MTVAGMGLFHKGMPAGDIFDLGHAKEWERILLALDATSHSTPSHSLFGCANHGNV